MPRETRDRGPLSHAEMLAHLSNGRSVLVSPAYETDEDGNYIEVKPGALATHPTHLPGVAELASNDPRAIAKAKVESQARLEAARREHDEILKAEADCRRKAEGQKAGDPPAEEKPTAPPAAAAAGEPKPDPTRAEADGLRQDIDRELKEREARVAEEQKAPEKAKADPRGAMKPPDVKGK